MNGVGVFLLEYLAASWKKNSLQILRKVFFGYLWLGSYNPQTSRGGQMDLPIGFSNPKFEAFKQAKWNFQYL